MINVKMGCVCEPVCVVHVCVCLEVVKRRETGTILRVFGFCFFTLFRKVVVYHLSDMLTEIRMALSWVDCPTCFACEFWRRRLMRPEETESISGRVPPLLGSPGLL